MQRLINSLAMAKQRYGLVKARAKQWLINQATVKQWLSKGKAMAEQQLNID